MRSSTEKNPESDLLWIWLFTDSKLETSEIVFKDTDQQKGHVLPCVGRILLLQLQQ